MDAAPEQALPMNTLTREQLIDLNNDTIHVIKLGHSSILLKVYGEFWLLEPVFAERASPFQFMGHKRFHPTPITIEQLPPIDKVLISHNHYDHLDKHSIKLLANKTKQFLVPLGVASDPEKWGIQPNKINEFDWWQEQLTPFGFIAFTPTKHFPEEQLAMVIKAYGDLGLSQLKNTLSILVVIPVTSLVLKKLASVTGRLT